MAFVLLKKEYKGQAAGTRIDVADVDADVLVKSGYGELVTGNPTLDLVNEAIAKHIAGMSGALEKALDAVLKKFSESLSLSQRGARAAIFGAAGEGDPKKTFGHYLIAVRMNDRKALEEMGSKFADWDADGQKAAMQGTSGVTGGYTVPTELLPRLMMVASEKALVRPRAYVHPMSSRSTQIPYLDVTNAPVSGDTAFFGGLVARWTEEAAALNETEPTVRQMELVAHELSGYSLASNSLLYDAAVGLEALLYELFGRAIAWYEDYAFLRGNGAGKPVGAFECPAAISVTRNTGAQFKLVDAGTMLSRLVPGWSAENLLWIFNPTLIPQLVQMVTTAAGVGWLGNLRDKMPMELLGVPAAISEKMAVLGTAKDCGLVDLRYYVIGDRKSIEIAYSEHVKFLNNQSAWRFVHRIDGQPWLRSTITLADLSTTVSPFIYLT